MSVYDVLEDRLLTKGIINHETDEQALRLQSIIQREIDKEKQKEAWELRREKWERQKEKVMKKVRWAFPDYHYMSSIYPTVEKAPVLLPVFWVIRGVRLMLRIFTK